MINKISAGLLHGYEITVDNAKMQIMNDYGCNINFLTLDNHEVLDTNDHVDDLIKDVLCKSDLLMPFPNRISDGTYTFENNTYQLDKNESARGHALHGLIIKRKFEYSSSNILQNSVAITFETTIKQTEFAGYPFDLNLKITFTLQNTSLTIKIKAENVGQKNAPYGCGWHPYLKAEKKIDDCQIAIPAESVLEVSTVKELIPTGKTQHNLFGTEKRMLGDTRFDTCFTDLVSHKVRFDNIELWMDESMKYLQIYTPEDRQSIAIEPMSCAPDAFNNGMGLIILRPGQEVTHEFGIRLI